MSDPNIAKFSGWFDNILGAVNTAIPVVASLASGGGKPKGCLVGQVSGDEAMSDCIPQVYAMFDQLRAQKGQLSPEQYIAGAEQIAAIFSNNQYFDQNKGGRSRELLTAAKAEAARRVDAIRAEVAAAQTGTTATVDPITGQTIIRSNTEMQWIAGVPNLYIVGGVGLIAVIAIMKR